MDKVSVLYTTWPSVETAEAAARALVAEKLAACANVFPAGKSFFIWKDQLETAAETVTIFKTSRQMEKPLLEKIKALHPYECPCIVSLDVTGGFAPFLAWINDATTVRC